MNPQLTAADDLMEAASVRLSYRLRVEEVTENDMRIRDRIDVRGMRRRRDAPHAVERDQES